MTVVAATEAEYQDELPEASERFLSALAFAYNLPIESESYGGSGESNPYWRSVVRVPRMGWGFAVYEPPHAIEVEDDEQLRLSLALYREGLNATSPFYEFLAFWNVLDPVFDGAGLLRDAFVAREGASVRHRWPEYVPWPADLPQHLRDSSRNAIAHVVRSPGRPVIDSDLPDDRRRLHGESRFLKELAAAAIKDRWPNGVRRPRRLTSD